MNKTLFVLKCFFAGYFSKTIPSHTLALMLKHTIDFMHKRCSNCSFVPTHSWLFLAMFCKMCGTNTFPNNASHSILAISRFENKRERFYCLQEMQRTTHTKSCSYFGYYECTRMREYECDSYIYQFDLR